MVSFLFDIPLFVHYKGARYWEPLGQCVPEFFVSFILSLSYSVFIFCTVCYYCEPLGQCIPEFFVSFILSLSYSVLYALKV